MAMYGHGSLSSPIVISDDEDAAFVEQQLGTFEARLTDPEPNFELRVEDGYIPATNRRKGDLHSSYVAFSENENGAQAPSPVAGQKRKRKQSQPAGHTQYLLEKTESKAQRKKRRKAERSAAQEAEWVAAQEAQMQPVSLPTPLPTPLLVPAPSALQAGPSRPTGRTAQAQPPPPPQAQQLTQYAEILPPVSWSASFSAQTFPKPRPYTSVPQLPSKPSLSTAAMNSVVDGRDRHLLALGLPHSQEYRPGPLPLPVSATHSTPPLPPSSSAVPAAQDAPTAIGPAKKLLGVPRDADKGGKQGAYFSDSFRHPLPDPSRTLVLAPIPKKFRTMEFVRRWAKRFARPQPLRIDVNKVTGKSLVEFQSTALAEMAFGSHRMCGEGKEHIRAWWYRGSTKNPADLEEGEIEEGVAEDPIAPLPIAKKKVNKKEKKAEKKKAQAAAHPHPAANTSASQKLAADEDALLTALFRKQPSANGSQPVSAPQLPWSTTLSSSLPDLARLATKAFSTAGVPLPINPVVPVRPRGQFAWDHNGWTHRIGRADEGEQAMDLDSEDGRHAPESGRESPPEVWDQPRARMDASLGQTSDDNESIASSRGSSVPPDAMRAGGQGPATTASMSPVLAPRPSGTSALPVCLPPTALPPRPPVNSQLPSKPGRHICRQEPRAAGAVTSKADMPSVVAPTPAVQQIRPTLAKPLSPTAFTMVEPPTISLSVGVPKLSSTSSTSKPVLPGPVRSHDVSISALNPIAKEFIPEPPQVSIDSPTPSAKPSRELPSLSRSTFPPRPAPEQIKSAAVSSFPAKPENETAPVAPAEPTPASTSAKRVLLERQKELEARIVRAKEELARKNAASTSRNASPASQSPPPVLVKRGLEAAPARESVDPSAEMLSAESALRSSALLSRKRAGDTSGVLASTPVTGETIAPSNGDASSSTTPVRSAEAVKNDGDIPISASNVTSGSAPAKGNILDFNELAVSFIMEALQTVKPTQHPVLPTRSPVPAPVSAPATPPVSTPTPVTVRSGQPAEKMLLAAKQKRLEQHIAESKVLMAKLSAARSKAEKENILSLLRERQRAMDEDNKAEAASKPASPAPASNVTNGYMHHNHQPPVMHGWKTRWPEPSRDAMILVISDDEDDEY